MRVKLTNLNVVFYIYVRIKYIYDYDSSSNEIRNITPMDITPDNHFSSSNIAIRVKARNERARRKTAHKQSQHFKTQNLGNTSSSESPSHEY